MLSKVVFQFIALSSFIIILLVCIKVYLFYKYKSSEWRIVNFFYFPEMDVRKQRELEGIKNTHNNLSLAISMLFFLLVLILLVK
jgi:hypothetical protein